jgi:glyoxylase-like metal-dependent hydrolase (beta-lactamase superfamily II)
MTAPQKRVPGWKVTDGVGRIAGFVNIYTYQEGGVTYLIDSGFSGSVRAIGRAFFDAKVPVEEVPEILLTHHHLDHSGGAAVLHERTQLPIACHTDDAPFVDGRVKPQIPFLMRPFVRFRPTPVATYLKDGDRIGSLQVVHVPGHTLGSVAFYEPDRKLLFSGDAVVERQGRLTLAPVRYAANVKQAVESLARLRGLEVGILLPGHGVPVVKAFNPLMDDLMRRAPGEFLGRAPG